jgi:hypothetical protein
MNVLFPLEYLPFKINDQDIGNDTEKRKDDIEGVDGGKY